MSLNAAALQFLANKGFSLEEVIEFAAIAERKRDNTSAERQARYRERRKERKSNARNSNGVTPSIEELHTPGSEISSDDEIQNKRAWVKPDWAKAQVWADFLGNRKTRKMKNTPTAFAGFLGDLQRATTPDWPPWRLLEHAAAKGWGSIHNPDESPQNDRQHSSVSKRTTRESGERVAASFARGGDSVVNLVPRLSAASGHDG